MHDVSIGNQLAGIVGSFKKGLDLPHAYPYVNATAGVYLPPHPLAGQSFPAGTVYSLFKFQQAAAFAGPSMLDWEPATEFPSYSTGTVTVVNGVVVLAGGTFPSLAIDGYTIVGGWFVPNPGPSAERYLIASRDSDTQITLVNTTLDVGSGSTFTVADPGWRQTDPHFMNINTVRLAHLEYAHAMELVKSTALANGAELGIYEFLVNLHTRNQDILDNPPGTKAVWQAEVAAACQDSPVLDVIRQSGGCVYYGNYTPTVFTTNGTVKQKYRDRCLIIAETLADLDVPFCPLFIPHTLEGLTDFFVTGNPAAERIPTDLLEGMWEDANDFQPGQWGCWGIANEWSASDLSLVCKAGDGDVVRPANV